MKKRLPSRTAQGAAMHRAAHQLVDRPPLFFDPLALKIIGDEAEAALKDGRDVHGTEQSAGLRAFIATRSRYAEDCLAEAVLKGTRQYVLLGAGLDTYAYREQSEGVRIFEVDHPATQRWKRARLKEIGLKAPAQITYAPVDFERETLREGLARAGFDFLRAATFAWLGVVPYLTRDAIMGTLGFVASLPSGSEIIFDYAEPPDSHDAQQRKQFDAMAARVAEAGEPFRSFFEPEPLMRSIKSLGFSSTEDLGRDTLNARYFAGRTDGLSLRGRAHLMHARV